MTESANLDEHGRPDPPGLADERDTILGFLDFLRATLQWKTGDLDDDQLRARLAPSEISLGGMLHHLAFVEDYWTSRLLGAPASPPWHDVDWDADPDWDWHVADTLSGATIRDRWATAVAASRHRIASLADLDAAEQRPEPKVGARWVLVHLVEEYARHVGHADLVRESIDGLTGE